jgi:hypothetical protein
MPAKSGLIPLGAVVLLIVLALAVQPQSQWDGIDVAVVGRFADELGHPASAPLLNVQGDMLLFVFTVGGATAGFILGYNWRALFGNEWAGGQRPGEAEKRDV